MWDASRSRWRKEASSPVSRSGLGTVRFYGGRVLDAMGAPDPIQGLLSELYRAHTALLPEDTVWFDCHTHTGQNDPDGFKATAEEIVAGLDMAGHHHALVFTTMEPDGYPAANDRVLAEAAASGGRLRAVARLDPHDDPVAEARRCLEAGAVGLKLHPRAERFEMH